MNNKDKMTLLLAAVAILLVAWSTQDSDVEEVVAEEEQVEIIEEVEDEEQIEEVQEETEEEEVFVEEVASEEIIEEMPTEPIIDTSAFKHALDTELIDARDITGHITVVVTMNDSINEGLASQHVLTDTYDFLQQEAVKQAETVTIGVMVGDMRVFQFTSRPSELEINDSVPMGDLVLMSSTIDKISPEVAAFADLFQWPKK